MITDEIVQIENKKINLKAILCVFLWALVTQKQKFSRKYFLTLFWRPLDAVASVETTQKATTSQPLRFAAQLIS